MEIITTSGDWKAKIEGVVKRFAESDGTSIELVELSKELYLILDGTKFLKEKEEEYNVSTVIAETTTGKYILSVGLKD